MVFKKHLSGKKKVYLSETKKLWTCLVKRIILSKHFEVQLIVFFPLKHNKFVFCMLLGKVQLGKEMEGKLLSACY